MISNFNSRLYDHNTFYKAFLHDIRHAKSRVIIESPFITNKRITTLLPIFKKLRRRNVEIVINTKPFNEHELAYRNQVIQMVGIMQYIGIEILLTTGHHRKIAIIDNEILYEGSLNILSQNDSCEFMRRIHDKSVVKQTIKFIGLNRWCK